MQFPTLVTGVEQRSFDDNLVSGLYVGRRICSEDCRHVAGIREACSFCCSVEAALHS